MPASGSPPCTCSPARRPCGRESAPRSSPIATSASLTTCGTPAGPPASKQSPRLGPLPLDGQRRRPGRAHPYSFDRGYFHRWITALHPAPPHGDRRTLRSPTLSTAGEQPWTNTARAGRPHETSPHPNRSTPSVVPHPPQNGSTRSTHFGGLGTGPRVLPFRVLGPTTRHQRRSAQAVPGSGSPVIRAVARPSTSVSLRVPCGEP
jgi:hypothetical protein